MAYISDASDRARERALQGLQPRDFNLGSEHVRLWRRAARISGIRRVHDIAGTCNLLVDERRRTPSLLKHEVRVRGIDAHVQGHAIRLGAEAIDIGQRRRASIPANAGERICCSIVTLTSAPPSMNGR
jgi:hypothetical protein